MDLYETVFATARTGKEELRTAVSSRREQAIARVVRVLSTISPLVRTGSDVHFSLGSSLSSFADRCVVFHRIRSLSHTHTLTSHFTH